MVVPSAPLQTNAQNVLQDIDSLDKNLHAKNVQLIIAKFAISEPALAALKFIT